MSAKNEVPEHFGPPRECTEVRLFGRYTLWTRYTWRRGKSIDEIIEGFTKPLDDLVESVMGKVVGTKRTVKLDKDPTDPIDKNGEVKP